MLYIESLNDFTVKFSDGATKSKLYSHDLVANADSSGRIWIKYKYKKGNVLNSSKVSEVSLWDGDEFIVYPDAAQFVSNFNLLMRNGTLIPPVTTTTTTEVTTTTTTGDEIPFNALVTLNGEYILAIGDGYVTT